MFIHVIFLFYGLVYAEFFFESGFYVCEHNNLRLNYLLKHEAGGFSRKLDLFDPLESRKQKLSISDK